MLNDKKISKTILIKKPLFLFLLILLPTWLCITVWSTSQLASHLDKPLSKLKYALATAQEITSIIFHLEILLQVTEKTDKCGNVDLLFFVKINLVIRAEKPLRTYFQHAFTNQFRIRRTFKLLIQINNSAKSSYKKFRVHTCE